VKRQTTQFLLPLINLFNENLRWFLLVVSHLTFHTALLGRLGHSALLHPSPDCSSLRCFVAISQYDRLATRVLNWHNAVPLTPGQSDPLSDFRFGLRITVLAI